MRKNILLISGCAAMFWLAACGGSQQERQTVAENRIAVDSTEFQELQTLSDKDVYFHPDTVVNGSEVLERLADAANSFAILRNAYCDAEYWIRLGIPVSEKIAKTQTSLIKDKEVREQAEKYVRNLTELLPTDTTRWEADDDELLKKVWKEVSKFGDFIYERYEAQTFGTVNDTLKVSYYDEKAFVKDYDELLKLRKEQTEANKQRLAQRIREAKNVDEECILVTEYAHQDRYDEHHPAMKMMERLMASGKHSRFMQGIWMTWRAMKQVNEISPSRDGIIPNRHYNLYRMRILQTIYREIAKHPKDMMLITEFLYLCSNDNITRYGEYIFGNQANMEMMILFPEITDEEEEEE